MAGKQLQEHFDKRLERVLEIIRSYHLNFEEIGIFGSYARGDLKTGSDIDICIITKERPDRMTSGSLRQDAEDLKCDIIYVSPEYFQNDASLFAQNLRRDYKAVIV